MNLLDLFVKIGVDDQASDKVSGISSKIGSGLKSAAKIGVAAVGAASTAILALGKIGQSYNQEMETYTTNFEVMLGSAEAAAARVEELKVMAAKTPFSMGDLSDATQTLLSFQIPAEETTGILQMLGDVSLGDATKMSSLATVFGQVSSAGRLQGQDLMQLINAGFNPLNYISQRTGESMEELRDRMAAGGIGIDEVTLAFKDATSAGGQFYQGMAKGAETTAGMIATLQDNARSLVGEVFQPISDGILTTLLPSAIAGIDSLTVAFQKDGVAGLIEAAGSLLSEWITKAVEYLPQVITFGMQLINSLLEGIIANLPVIVNSAATIILQLATGLISALPMIIQAGLQVLIMLANGIAESLPTLIPTIVDVVLQIVDTLTNPDTLSSLIDAAIAIIMGLADGLIAALPELIAKAPEIIQNLVDAIVENVPKLLIASAKLVIELAKGIIKNIPQLLVAAGKIVISIVDGISALMSSILNIGKNIVAGVWDGIKEKAAWLTDKVKGFFKNIVDGAKKALGIASPSKVFASIGRFSALGVGEGFSSQLPGVLNDMQKALDIGGMGLDVGVSASGVAASGVAGVAGNVTNAPTTINIRIDKLNAANDDEIKGLAVKLDNYRRDLLIGRGVPAYGT